MNTLLRILLLSCLVLTSCDQFRSGKTTARSSARRPRLDLPAPTPASAVDRFVHPESGARQHSLVSQTQFPNALPPPVPAAAQPILAPRILSQCLAHSITVGLDALEVRSLEDGRIQICARLRNRTGSKLETAVACTFESEEKPQPPPTNFTPLSLAPNQSADVFWISPRENLISYVILVRPPGTLN